MINKYFGSIKFYKRALSIAVPVMLQQFIQTLVSLIDNFMVAGLGDIKMAGVNISNSINFLFFIVIDVICISGGVFMCQFFGAKNSSGMEQSFKYKLLLGLPISIIYSLFMFIAPRNIFNLMVTQNSDAVDIVNQAIIYSKANSISWIFMALSTVIASSLRDIEFVKAPLIISSIATLINTFFNWVLIYGNLGMPRLEVVGAAYATDIARIAEFIIYLIYLLIKKPDFIFKISNIFKIDFSLIKRIARKSTLVFYSQCLWAISELISTALYNTRGGAYIVSGMSAGLTIAHLFFISFSGICVATSVIIGQELGAGNLTKVRAKKMYLLNGSIIYGLIFLLFGMTTTFLVPIIFTKLSFLAQETAKKLIFVAAAYTPLWIYINCQYSISRAGGDMKTGAICDSISNVLFIGGLFLLIYTTNLNPVTLYALVKLSDIPKLTIAHILLKKEHWIVNLTKK